MNATTIESLGRPVEARPVRPRLLYPALLIAAISVTLFSLIGIAAMTGLMPSAHSTTPETATAKPLPKGKSVPAASTSAATGKTRIAAASCSGCGTVESISTVERQADTSGVGAVAGGLTGALLGNQIGRGNGRTVMTSPAAPEAPIWATRSKETRVARPPTRSWCAWKTAASARSIKPSRQPSRLAARCRSSAIPWWPAHEIDDDALIDAAAAEPVG